MKGIRSLFTHPLQSLCIGLHCCLKFTYLVKSAPMQPEKLCTFLLRWIKLMCWNNYHRSWMKFDPYKFKCISESMASTSIKYLPKKSRATHHCMRLFPSGTFPELNQSSLVLPKSSEKQAASWMFDNVVSLTQNLALNFKNTSTFLAPNINYFQLLCFCQFFELSFAKQTFIWNLNAFRVLHLKNITSNM